MIFNCSPYSVSWVYLVDANLMIHCIKNKTKHHDDRQRERQQYTDRFTQEKKQNRLVYENKYIMTKDYV